MKINWKAMAMSLVMLVGISGAAFGQDRDDHRIGDRDDRARVVTQYRDHDRDDRGWNRRVFDRDDRRLDNKWYGDHDRHDGDRFGYKDNYRQGYGR